MVETVILVPGIGLSGIEFFVLARHLRNHGWRRGLAANAKALHHMLAEQQTKTHHLITSMLFFQQVSERVVTFLRSGVFSVAT